MHLKELLLPATILVEAVVGAGGGVQSALENEGSFQSHLPSFKCWQEINSAKRKFCFHPTPACLALKLPVPALPTLFSRINHSFQPLAAVYTIVTRSEMQLRNNSDLTVFSFYVAIRWRAIFNGLHPVDVCDSTCGSVPVFCWTEPSQVPGTLGPHQWDPAKIALACHPLWPFGARIKNSVLSEAQVTLVELNKRPGVICQVLHRRFGSLCHRKEFEVRTLIGNTDESTEIS